MKQGQIKAETDEEVAAVALKEERDYEVDGEVLSRIEDEEPVLLVRTRNTYAHSHGHFDTREKQGS